MLLATSLYWSLVLFIFKCTVVLEAITKTSKSKAICNRFTVLLLTLLWTTKSWVSRFFFVGKKTSNFIVLISHYKNRYSSHWTSVQLLVPFPLLLPFIKCPARVRQFLGTARRSRYQMILVHTAWKPLQERMLTQNTIMQKRFNTLQIYEYNFCSRHVSTLSQCMSSSVECEKPF